MKVTIMAAAAVLAASTPSHAGCWRCGPGPVIAGIVSGLAGAALAANAGRYVPGPPPEGCQQLPLRTCRVPQRVPERTESRPSLADALNEVE